MKKLLQKYFEITLIGEHHTFAIEYNPDKSLLYEIGILKQRLKCVVIDILSSSSYILLPVDRDSIMS